MVASNLSTENNNFSELFLLTFAVTEKVILSIPLNNGIKPFTKPALPIGWHRLQ